MSARATAFVDGWAAMDGLGLVGRDVRGRRADSSRVLLLTDSTFSIPVTVQPSARRAPDPGQTPRRPSTFLEKPRSIRPGIAWSAPATASVSLPALLVGAGIPWIRRAAACALAADYRAPRIPACTAQQAGQYHRRSRINGGSAACLPGPAVAARGRRWLISQPPVVGA